jgi:hypothetical protein
LYVSNQTIYLGSVPLSLDANNNLTVNGSPVTGGGNSFDQDLNTDDSVTFNSVGATTVNVSQINGTNPGDELVIQQTIIIGTLARWYTNIAQRFYYRRR